MKEGIHPEYIDCEISCACGNSFQTRATVPKIRVDVCSNCHPIFTGNGEEVRQTPRVE